jgi:hypothetical protein
MDANNWAHQDCREWILAGRRDAVELKTYAETLQPARHLANSVLGKLLASRPNCADSLAFPGEATLPNPLDSYFVQHEDLATQQLQLPFAARLNSPNGQTCCHYFLKNL